MNDHRDAVVIGAGISGLACAYRLKRLGLDVALIEKSERVGGVMQSEFIGEFLIERGPNSSQGTEELLSLVEELGISDKLVEGDPKAPAYVYFDGQLHPVPSGPGAFIKSNLLSARGKLRILAEIFVPARQSQEEESVASFARRRMGSEAAARLIAPFVSGIYAGDSESLSVQAAFPKLASLESGYGGLFRGMLAKAREARQQKKTARAGTDKAAPARKRLVSFQSGMGFLPETLARHIGESLLTVCSDIKIQLSSPTSEGLKRKTGNKRSSGFAVEFNRSGSAALFTCDEVVVATPARVASQLVSPLSNDLRRLLEEIEHPPLSIVYLAYDKSRIAHPLNGFGFLVAPSERLNILGCVWNSSLFEGRAPNQKALLTVFIGGARNAGLARLGDAELVSTAHIELQKILKISGEAQVIAITRWERAIPQYNLGHAARVRRIESLLEEARGLRLIGNYLHGVSTGDCIREADRVARKIAVGIC